ncbi:MAG: hypothetical protein P8O04_05575 [Flavobacteriaceae bacterium]|nr:hypothetical protein [Flavobacteriaceae bacterium]
MSKLKAPEGVKWLLDQSETKIQGLINDRIGRYIADTDVVEDTGS